MTNDYGWAWDNPGAIGNELLNNLPSWLVGDVLNTMQAARIQASPLVLDLDGDGIELTDLDSSNAVYWDIDQDGFAEASGWVAPDDGLLAADRNGNGIIDSHAELFGTETRNGFLFLKEYDTNADNAITSADTGFNDLRVWKDTNTNGVNDDGELHTLSNLGITSINLNYSPTTGTIAGNDIRYTSTFTQGGNTRTIVDTWFSYDNSNTVYNQDYTLDIRTLFLPTLRGYGNLPDLHIAMSINEDLLDMMSEIATADLETLFSAEFGLYNKIHAFMLEWGGVTDVNPTGRGQYVDGRELAFLEEITDAVFQQRGYINPAWQGSTQLG